jgi:hypothetical protein
MWASARAEARAASDVATRLEKANGAVGRVVGYLCDRVFREDPEVLRRPAGGAAAYYSIASGSDNWASVFAFWRERPPDRPIQPVGLTGPDEALAFVAWVNRELVRQGRPPYFTYPSRDAGDFCAGAGRPGALHPALRCTAEEIEAAMGASPRVEGLTIPPRGR